MEESESAAAMINQSRKEKRKALKKMKRKQTRKEIALKHLDEQVSDDREEQEELEEAKRMSESVRLIFEERERAWLQALEIRNKRKQEEEEELSRNQQQIETAKENDDDDDEWEYVEEGPAEIILNGNEITIKKKTVKVPKRNNSPKPNSTHEGADRPTSNPLPPQSLAFDDYKKSSLSAQQLIDTVAEQVPHFGTEQDKDHCPFHLKTGACRFGQHCSRVHFYPDQSCTLLIKNMYNGPGLTWEHDDGLEYTDEEIECCYEEFYEDVHTEFLKFGEIVNFKVCRNGASHLRGNVYVQYSALESALLAHQYINGRYFAGKQISCEFINVTRWKVAICGEYVKSRYKTCSRGTACNFIHCFCNPGGDYEWADSDRPPPKYWVEKIVALFGYSDAYRKQIREDNTGQLRNSRMSMTDSRRYIVRRSRSRDRSYSSSTGSGRRYDNEYFTPKGTSHRRSPGEDNTYMKDYNHRKDPKHYIESDGKFLDTDEYMDRDARHGHRRKSSGQEKRTRRSSSEQEKPGLCHDGDREKIDHQVGGDQSTRDKNRELYRDSRKSSGHKRRVGYERKDHKSKSQDSDGEWSDSISSGDEHHGTSKSSVRIGDTSERSKERENSRRSCTTEFSGNSGHARRSKHWDKVTDDNRYPTQDVKHIAEAEAPVKRLKPDNGRCTSDVQIDKQDRWEPGNHSEGNAGSSESHKSSDYVSKLNYDDNVSKGEHWCEAGEVTSSKHQKARRRSTKSNGEHEHGKRSRGSNKSNSSDAVMDPSEDNESRVLNKHLASHGAGDQKRHHKKRSRE